MRISDWSSDVCSSDLLCLQARRLDTSDSAHFVLVGQIARNAYRAHWQAFIVDDDNAPCRRYDASGRDGSERGDEGWSVGGQFPYLARGKPKEQRASGLAGRDLQTAGRGAGLTLDGDRVAARIRHADAQRLEMEFLLFGECARPEERRGGKAGGREV